MLKPHVDQVSMGQRRSQSGRRSPRLQECSRLCAVVLGGVLSVLPIGGTGLSLVGLTTGVWLATTTLMPPVAQAYTSEVNVVVDWGANETFEALAERAEMLARTTAQRLFETDILITDVAVTVSGSNGSSIVPILELNVSREDWRRRPDPRYWATYYRSAKVLLELDSPPPNTAIP